MTSISPSMRSGLYRQMSRMYAATEHEYEEFISEARRALPEETKALRFEFVVRRLWMTVAGDPSPSWRLSLAERYRAFEAAFDWEADPEQAEAWISRPLVERTLSLWQVRYPVMLNVRGAVEMLSDTTRLLVAKGGNS